MMKLLMTALGLLFLVNPAFADCTTPTGFKRIGSAYWRMANLGFPNAPGFERLPATVPSDITTDVTTRGRFGTGRAAHIRTNADKLHLCYENGADGSNKHYWSYDGSRGGDVYYRPFGTTEWVWLSSVPATDPNNFEIMIDLGSSSDREFMVYFPAYARLLLLRVEVPTAATITAGPAPAELPLVFLGTSITQGFNNSRPGLAYPAIVGRNLNRDAINLGFSGSCNLYAGFADLLDDIPASAYIIDCFQNMSLTAINSLMYDFGDDLASAVYPAPVIFFEQSYDQLGFADNSSRATETAAAYAIYQSLAAVHSNVFWVDTDGMLGTDGAATSDGIHPNDLGHTRMADYYTTAIAALL